LRWLFASPEFHHWHHSDNREARDKNFAGQLSFLDALFGSLHLPRGQVPTAYGLDQPMPQRYVPQLIYPFVGDRIFQSTSDAGVIGETMRAPEGAEHPATGRRLIVGAQGRSPIFKYFQRSLPDHLRRR